MAKKTAAKERFNWTLQIEFAGLLVVEPFFKQKKMIVHLVDDSLHVPAFTARLRDLKQSEDCVPTYTLMSTEDDMAVTLGAWPIRRGAAMTIPPNAQPFDLDIPQKKPKPCETAECSDSISALANLNKLLSARRCQTDNDNPTFLLTHGRVTSGRCDPKMIFRILVNGDEVFKGNLALSVIYQLKLTNRAPVTLDLHPGKVSVGPPDNADSGYLVATTITNFPTTHMGPDDVPHFVEYNRIAGTNFDIEVVMDQVGQFPDDPIHCVPASLSSEI
jgi:hypothetical protein